MFATLSDRLAATIKNLRGKGRLTEADIEETIGELRGKKQKQIVTALGKSRAFDLDSAP